MRVVESLIGTSGRIRMAGARSATSAGRGPALAERVVLLAGVDGRRVRALVVRHADGHVARAVADRVLRLERDPVDAPVTEPAALRAHRDAAAAVGAEQGVGL